MPLERSKTSYERAPSDESHDASDHDDNGSSSDSDASSATIDNGKRNNNKDARDGNAVHIEMKIPDVNLNTDRWYSFHQLARNGDYELMQKILQKLPYHVCQKKMNQLDKDHLAPLHYAARYNHVEVIKVLVTMGADVNIAGEDGLMPLHFAARYRMSTKRESFDATDGTSENVSVISILTSAEACVNCKDDYGLTPLHYAAMRGNEKAAKDLLQTPNINTEVYDKQEMTPLHLAAMYGYKEIVLLLLEAGASIDAEDDKGCTPLHKAAAEGSLDVVKLLLEVTEKQACESGISAEEMISKQDNERNTPLHHAIRRGHLDIVELLLERGVDVNVPRSDLTYPIHLAAASGSSKILKLLIEKGADVNCSNCFGLTPLHISAGLNDTESIELLLKSGANIECRDSANHLTPLLIAVSKGYKEAVSVLLKHKAKTNVADKNDRTAVYLAAQENNADVLEFLLKHKKFLVLIDRGDRYDDSPLHIACKKGYLKSVEVLLKFGASIENKNEDGKTALHFAAQAGWPELIDVLVKHGKCVVNNEDEDSNTPLHLASLHGHAHVVKLLLRHGADHSTKNCYLWTPLDCAASSGHANVVFSLLKAGANIDAVGKNKTTPLHLAAKAGHADVIKLLLEWGANVTQRAYKGENCLDLAIDNGKKEAALAILKSDMWEDALRNMIEGDQPGTYETPIRKLIVNMPDVAEYVFDRCVKTNGKAPHDVDLQVTFYFEFLDDMFSQFHVNNDSNLPPKYSVYTRRGRVKSGIKPHTEDREILKKYHPLMIMVRTKRQSLLGHPLCTSLVDHKWRIYGRYVYFINLFLFLVFLYFLTAYILVQSPPHLDVPISATNTTCNKSDSCIITKPREPSAFEMTAKHFIIVLSIIHVLKELFQFYQNKLHYFTLENAMEWTCYITAFIFVMDFTRHSFDTGYRLAWQWEIGAVSIFLAWMVLLLFIRKFPLIGIYIVMFTVIMKTFGRFCFVFILFIVAFALVFFMLLQNQDPFENPWESIVKTTVMMIGEMEYDEIFNNPENQVYHRHATFILFVVFLVIMSIIIMNLLVGLAVDDIKGVQEQAVLERLAMRVEMVLSVESLLPMWVRRKCIWQKSVVHPNKWKCNGRLAKFFRFWDEKMVLMSIRSREQGLCSDMTNKKLTALEEDIQELKMENKRLQRMMISLLQNSGLSFPRDKERDDAP